MSSLCAYVLSQIGDNEKANEVFRENIDIVEDFIDQGSTNPLHKYNLAASYAFTGKREKALDILNELPYWYVTYGLLQIDPMFNSLRKNQKFLRILKRQSDEMMQFRKEAQLDDHWVVINRFLDNI